MKPLSLGDIMHSPVLCLSTDGTAASTLTAMREQGVDVALIVHDQNLMGLITKQSIQSLAATTQHFETLPVTDIMESAPVTVNAGLSCQEGYELMARHGHRSLAIMKHTGSRQADARPIGLVTERRLLDHFFAQAQSTPHESVGTSSTAPTPTSPAAGAAVNQPSPLSQDILQDTCFQAVFNASYQFAVLMSPTGVILDANQAALNFAKYRPQDVLGLPFHKAGWWSGNVQRVAQLQGAIQQAAQGQRIRYNVDIDGYQSTETIDFSLKPVRDSQKKITLLLAEGHIITDQVNARAHLLQSQERYQSFITHTTETVFSIEPDTPIPIWLPREQQIEQLLSSRVVTANNAMAKRYGYHTAVDMVGFTIEQLHIQSGCTDDLFLSRWIDSDYQFHGYVSLSDNNGNRNWYSNNLVGIIENGCLIRLWGTQNDITVRIKAEQALTQSEQLQRGILNSMIAEIAVICQEGHILAVNTRWEEATLQNTQPHCQLIQGSINKGNYLQHLSALARHRNHAQQALDGINSVLSGSRQRFSMEYACSCSDDQRWLSMDVTPLPNCGVVLTSTDITSRKVAELALTESEAHLQLALDAGGAGAWVWDIKKDRIYTDERFARLFGINFFDHEQGLSLQQVLDGIHPEDRDQAQRDFKQALTSPSPSLTEYRVIGEGKTRWVTARGRTEWNKAGHPVRFSGAVSDITELKRSEQALRSERDLHSQYLSTMETLMVVLDQQGGIVMVNRAACELLQYHENELIGQNWHHFCAAPEATPESTLPSLQHSLAQQSENVEYKEGYVTDRHGQWHLIAWHNAILRDTSGIASGMLSSGQNITRQRQMENDLRDSERTLRTIFDQAGVGVALIDTRTGRFLRTNPKYTSLLGYTQEEFCQKTTYDVTHPDDRAQDRQSTDKMLRGEIQQCSLETRYRHKDGSLIWAALTASSIESGTDGHRHHIAVMQDITERKVSEQRLRQAEWEWTQAMDQFDDTFYLIDLNHCLIRANHAFYRTINTTPEKCVGHPINTLLCPNGASFPCPTTLAHNHKQEITLVLETGDPQNPTNGPIEASLKLVHDHQNNPTGMLVALRDLSNTRHIQERLRLAGIVFDNTNEGIMVVDAQCKIIEINKAFTDLLGYGRHEVIGRNPDILKSCHHNDAFYQSMLDTLKQTGQWRGEIWHQTKDKSLFPEWQTITQINDEYGNLAQYVAVFSDISMIKQSQEKFAHLAHHDPLTQLPNRLLLTERLEQAIAQAARHQTKFALMFLDVDNFKHINDSLGHPVGDQLLRVIARKLNGALRDEDTVARVSGDEFVILLNGIDDPYQAAVVAEKLTSSVALPCQLDQHEIAVTSSVGICLYPDDGNTPATLLRNADAAMYHAKEAGRNTFRFYTERLTQNAFERVMLENNLRQAIKKQELRLVYQPQIDLATGLCIGVEALLRWEHAQQGMISPARFIPMAEDSGLIHIIGDWVLRTACQQGVQWLRQGLNIGRIAVNIAGPQLQRGNLVKEVKAVLDETGFPPEHLELEVTEGFIMKQAESAIGYLIQLREMGVTLAIDDFGTGYSSLSYLTKLPVHKLKIDQSFVRDIPFKESDIAIASAVIAMGNSLGMTVIAEGVETPEQAEFLKQRHCEEAQGYLYSKPLETDKAGEFFRGPHLTS